MSQLQTRARSLLDGVHATGEVREQGRVDVDDPARERLQEWRRVDPVIACVDDQLDAMVDEEVAHRSVAVLGRNESLLRQLTQSNPALPSERGAAARRPVGGHGDNVESSIDEVA